MQVKKYNPFPISFVHVSIEDWQNKKTALENLVDWEDPECLFPEQFTDFYKYISPGDDCGTKYTKDFINILKPELISIAHSLGGSIKIKDLWAQRYHKNMYMQPHTHGHQDYSAVLYHDFCKGHKSTIFFAPYKNPLDGIDFIHAPEIKEGDMIVFPSFLMHFAEPNLIEAQRTIFSFNFKVDLTRTYATKYELNVW